MICTSERLFGDQDDPNNYKRIYLHFVEFFGLKYVALKWPLHSAEHEDNWKTCFNLSIQLHSLD